MEIRKLAFILVLIILATQVIGCSTNTSVISTASVVVFNDWKQPEKFESKISGNIKSVKIELNAQCTSGTIEYEIRDSNGKVVWNGQVNKGQNLNKVKQFPANKGTWNTYVISKNGEGNFGVKFLRNDN